jgi:hypothetical protein
LQVTIVGPNCLISLSHVFIWLTFQSSHIFKFFLFALDTENPGLCRVCVCVCVDILYMNNLQTGSVLDYTLKFLVAVLVRSRERWDFPSKSGLIEITVSKEYHRIYSAIQFVSNLVLKITQ